MEKHVSLTQSTPRVTTGTLDCTKLYLQYLHALITVPPEIDYPDSIRLPCHRGSRPAINKGRKKGRRLGKGDENEQDLCK